MASKEQLPLCVQPTATSWCSKRHRGRAGDEPAFLEGGDESLSSLPIVSVDGAPGDALERRRPPASPKLEPHHAETAQEIDIFANIERLAELQQKGILSPEEFAAKKTELLSGLWAECSRC